MISLSLWSTQLPPHTLSNYTSLTHIHVPLLVAHQISLANFTDPVEYPCLGCQDGYLAEYLTTKAGWEFARMPIDGLKSIAFHGPSPTLCVAAGELFVLYLSSNIVGCVNLRSYGVCFQ